MHWGSVPLGTLILWGLVRELLAFQSALPSPSAIHLGIAQTIPGCVTGALVKLQQWAIVGSVSLGNILMTSLLWAPSKQHSSQECVRGTPLCLSQESPCCCHPSRSRGCVGCHRADGAAWLSSSTSPDAMGLYSLQSREEVLQGHARLQASFSCRFMFLRASVLHFAPLCSVCASRGVVGWLATGCESTADWAWNQLCSSAPLILSTILTACCNSV